MEVKNDYNECLTNLACSIRKYFGLEYKHNIIEYIDKILVTVWPEPLGINATPEELKTQEYFDLDADGVADAGNWINKQFFDNADKWKDALNKGLL